jgi:hypothetical protein
MPDVREYPVADVQVVQQSLPRARRGVIGLLGATDCRVHGASWHSQVRAARAHEINSGRAQPGFEREVGSVAGEEPLGPPDAIVLRQARG